MSATLNWELRNCLKDLRDEGRLAVLIALVLHSNIRMRCWVSVDLLVAETGWSRPLVSNAKAWLEEHGAFALVPYDKRVDEEIALPIRQHVYQLTGTLMIDGKAFSYLYMNPETETAIRSVLAAIHDSKAGERSLDERSVGERKDSTSSKDDPIFEEEEKKEKDSIAENAIGDDEDSLGSGNSLESASNEEGSDIRIEDQIPKPKRKRSRDSISDAEIEKQNALLSSREAWFEAIAFAFGIQKHSGHANNIETMLSGRAVKGKWAQYKFEAGILTPAHVVGWRLWKNSKSGPNPMLPEKCESIHESFEVFLAFERLEITVENARKQLLTALGYEEPQPDLGEIVPREKFEEIVRKAKEDMLKKNKRHDDLPATVYSV